MTDTNITLSAPKKNSDAFVAFLDHLIQHFTDGRPILLVLDNASYHHSDSSRAGFAALEDQLMLLFLPAYCSDLNPIERYWRHLKDFACANKLFPSMAALVVTVLKHLHRQNDQVNPERFTICKDLDASTYHEVCRLLESTQCLRQPLTYRLADAALSHDQLPQFLGDKYI